MRRRRVLLWGRLAICGGLAIRLRVCGLTRKAAPNPGRRIDNPPQVTNLPHKVGNLPHKCVALISVRSLHRVRVLAGALGPFRAVFLDGKVAQHRKAPILVVDEAHVRNEGLDDVDFLQRRDD